MRKPKQTIIAPVSHNPRPPLEPIVISPSEEFKSALLDEIQRMEQEHILYRELISHISTALNALYKDEKIKVGPTINDKYISTITE